MRTCAVLFSPKTFVAGRVKLVIGYYSEKIDLVGCVYWVRITAEIETPPSAW